MTQIADYPPSGKAAAVLYAKNLDQVSAFYEQVTGMISTESTASFKVLESATFELTVVTIPPAIAESISITTPPDRREDTPIKLVFLVASIAIARATAARCGGELNAAEREWHFRGFTVCDGHDPEGNVFQVREQTR